MTTDNPIVWTISGSDCSGGAGIAADLRTAHALKAEMCHIITANTVQNSQQVFAVHPVDVDVMQQQADALLQDKTPQTIKVGLIANNAQADWLLSFLTTLKQHNPKLMVVLDPVGQASVGGKLSNLSQSAMLALIKAVDIVTPNLQEAQRLSDSATEYDTKTLAQNLRELGAKSVIVKGGHSEGDHREGNHGESKKCTDVCLHDEKDLTHFYGLASSKINTRYSHGTGCTFASAMACFIAHGYLVRDAFMLTKAFINQGLMANRGKNDHYGAFAQTHWPNQPEAFAKVDEQSVIKIAKTWQRFPSLDLPHCRELGLYPVVDSADWIETLMPLSLSIIQLRVKHLSGQALEDEISRAIKLTKGTNTRLFINDYWQLAIKHNAYGVHIGQEDLLDADLAQIHQAGLRLGISTHGCYEFALAQQLSPSYLAMGAIFPTKTKDMTGQIQGLDNLRQCLALREDIPVVAIGGINQARIGKVWQTGVDSVAVVTAITEAQDPLIAAKQLQEQLTF